MEELETKEIKNFKIKRPNQNHWTERFDKSTADD
jgi:hypothetical protein